MRPVLKIVPMKQAHIRACEAIVAASDPWKLLGERVSFRRALAGNRTGTAAYVCTRGPVTAGFILFIPEPVFARGGYLRAIGVDSGFRQLGIGRLLLSFAELKTSKHSTHLFLCVSSFNRSAQAFYKSCGYTRVGTLPDFIKPGASEYIYWKPLKPAVATGRRLRA
jgi:ribosomal-protein-alanine N-acetyltransferase